MACQGCGRVSQTRLCCPTCIEFGRTTFFCSQECFTKNWKSHGQLHELLKQKAALAGGAGASPGGLADADLEGLPSPPRPKPPGRTEDMPSLGAATPASSTRRTLAPLAGGMSYGANKGGMNGNVAAAKRRQDEASASGPASILTSVVGSTWNLLSSSLRSGDASSAAGAKGATAVAAGTRRPSGGTGGAASQSQPKGGSAQSGAKTPWWTSLTRRFALNGLLWALALTTIVASGMFYREHLRYGNDRGVDQSALDVPDIKTAATADVRGAPPEDAPAPADGPSVLAGLGLGASSPTAPPSEGTSAPSSSQVSLLRSEVGALRDLVERHDKMLRYVMDRYVEKANTAATDAATRNSNTHEVSFESVSKSANYDVSAVPSAVRAGGANRKRRGGGDDVPMGQPEMEGESGLAPSEQQVQAQASAAQPEVPPSESSPKQESLPNQLGI